MDDEDEYIDYSNQEDDLDDEMDYNTDDSKYNNTNNNNGLKNEDATQSAEEGKRNAVRNTRKGSLRRKIGTLKENIQGALRGDSKDILILKVKLVVYVVIGIIILFALMVEGVAQDTSDKANSSVSSTYSSSTSQGAEEYKQTGSLTMATEEEVTKMKDNLLNTLEKTDKGYHDTLETKYSGKTSSSVANKVTHITTNVENGTTAELELIEGEVVEIEGMASPKEERTLSEHIFMTEKYNFNNIIWRSFEKSGDSLVEKDITFTVDSETKLKYPKSDSSDLDNSSHNLSFFLSKARPYLQSWHIPYDLIVGTRDAQSNQVVNADFAYEIITSAYHEIVLDRYKTENLTRVNNYAIYDKTTTVTKVYRTCNLYLVNVATETGERMEPRTLCTDSTQEYVSTANNIRENISSNETKSYRWNYVVSQAKMFDRVISNKYSFEAYKNYSNNNYNNFVNTKGDFINMTVDEFKEYESKNSKADEYTHDSKDYHLTDTYENIIDNRNDENVKDSIPSYIIPMGNEETFLVKEVTETVIDGKEYIDTYTWSDKLTYESSQNGIYNVESVKDVTGDDFTADDTKYYKSLYASQEINLIDIMNSDPDRYSNYMSESETSQKTNNIGIRKEKLSISYDVLKRNLTKLSEDFPISGLMYGSSLGINSVGFSMLGGLNLNNITASGGINKTIVDFANQFVGKDLSFMMTIDDVGIFKRQHWCADFVSYCMRKIQKETGVKIPIPSYTGCSSFWRQNNTKPGFYDVIESRAKVKTTDTLHLASIEQIQPGDIVLFEFWDDGYPRDHTAIVKEVVRDEEGKVTNVITIDGNWGGNSFNDSKVCVVDHFAKNTTGQKALNAIASFVRPSMVLAEIQKGNIW